MGLTGIPSRLYSGLYSVHSVAGMNRNPDKDKTFPEENKSSMISCFITLYVDGQIDEMAIIQIIVVSEKTLLSFKDLVGVSPKKVREPLG